ncbi:hypothetical protein [Aliiruegeria haliotis]|nr:hypothetical protein [Aliiruegeria haliotis]
MFKTLSAAALSSTLALAGFATPAHADQEDIARFIIGTGLLAILSKAIEETRDDDRRMQYVNPSLSGAPIIYGQPQYQQPVIIQQPQPQPKVVHKHITQVVRQPTRVIEHHTEIVKKPTKKVIHKQKVTKPRKVEILRDLPSACAKTMKTRGGNRTFLTQGCLERSGIRTTTLPAQCGRVLDMPGKARDRRGWNRKCLKQEGYRIR